MDPVKLGNCNFNAVDAPMSMQIVSTLEKYFMIGERTTHEVMHISGDQVTVGPGKNEPTPMWQTVLKVISYVLIIFPIIVGIALLAAKMCSSYKIQSEAPSPPPAPTSRIVQMDQIADVAPAFNRYMLTPANPSSEPCLLTALPVRPANLFFNSLFEGSEYGVVQPGQGLFALTGAPQYEIREHLRPKADHQEISITAKGKQVGQLKLEDFYGTGIFKLSAQEVWNLINSQRVYLSSLLPKPFYQKLKEAMLADKIVTLPQAGREKARTLLSFIQSAAGYTHLNKLISDVRNNLEKYDFTSLEEFNQLIELDLYHLGSMVVKTEDYYLFIDEKGHILDRQVGASDKLQLINACGIRGIYHDLNDPTKMKLNKTIITELFKTALTAAKDGVVVFPAVGMGVWRGPPEIYWEGFLEAVAHAGSNLERIYISPGHQATANGLHRGKRGEEFQEFLDQFLIRYKDNPKALANLQKVRNQFDKSTDILQLARLLKKQSPENTISVFNASDPDVTLGYHVGEYVNNLPHGASTTEENFTAAGTNGLCFEGVTAVHNYMNRVISMRA